MKFATYNIEGEGEHWWRSVEALYYSRGLAITWELFQKEFNDRFFPEAVKREREVMFQNLKQGDMSVSEYEGRFRSLLRFVPDMASNETRAAHRFQDGLNAETRKFVSMFNLRTVSEVAEKARTHELEAKREAQERLTMFMESKAKQQLDFEARKGKGQVGQKRKFSYATQVSTIPTEAQSGSKIQKTYAGQKLKDVVCYYCKQHGHMKRKCRKLQKKLQHQGQPTVNQSLMSSASPQQPQSFTTIKHPPQ